MANLYDNFDYFLFLRRGDPQFFASTKKFNLNKPVITISPLLALQSKQFGFSNVRLLPFERIGNLRTHHKIESQATQLALEFDIYCSEIRSKILNLPSTRGWIFYYLQRLIISQALLKPCGEFFDRVLPNSEDGIVLYPDYGQLYDFDCRNLRNLALPRGRLSRLTGICDSLYPTRPSAQAFKRLPQLNDCRFKILELIVAPALYPESQLKLQKESFNGSVLLESPIYNDWLPKDFKVCPSSSEVFDFELSDKISSLRNYLNLFREGVVSFFDSYGLTYCDKTLGLIEDFSLFQILYYYLLTESRELRFLKTVRMGGVDDGLLGPVSSFASHRNIYIKTYGHTHFEVDYFPIGTSRVDRSTSSDDFLNIALQFGYSRPRSVDVIEFPVFKEIGKPTRVMIAMSSLDDAVETPYLNPEKIEGAFRNYIMKLKSIGCEVKFRPRKSEYWSFLALQETQIAEGPIEGHLAWPDFTITFGQATSAMTLFRRAGSRIHFLSTELPSAEAMSRIPNDTSVFIGPSLAQLFSNSLEEITYKIGKQENQKKKIEVG